MPKPPLARLAQQYARKPGPVAQRGTPSGGKHVWTIGMEIFSVFPTHATIGDQRSLDQRPAIARNTKQHIAGMIDNRKFNRAPNSAKRTMLIWSWCHDYAFSHQVMAEGTAWHKSIIVSTFGGCWLRTQQARWCVCVSMFVYVLTILAGIHIRPILLFCHFVILLFCYFVCDVRGNLEAKCAKSSQFYYRTWCEWALSPARQRPDPHQVRSLHT